jgi:murein DD-endopeptidase MepM/ murein hydrolase activator NlpD
LGRRTALLAAGLAAAALASGSPGAVATPGFRLADAEVSPRSAFFDAPRKVELRYRLRAPAPNRLRIRVVRAHTGNVVRHWVERDPAAGRSLARAWNGRRGGGRVAADGRYRFKLGPPGGPTTRSPWFAFHGYRFPVRGPHTYGDRYGVPRSGGRVHEGQDVVADCGTPLVAARGGRVQGHGYSASLYGYWVLIDGRATRQDHFYAHLREPTPLARGERVRTGERIGVVGKTGNARSEFCQLHFELWPRGYRRGSPADPLPALQRWDRFS